ncbi:MAG: hypothetical protein ABSD76_16355 [Terriglobales bacterium]|jgi:hypothetical protein
MKHLGLLLSAFLLVVCGSASASITEIRKDFFNRTTNLHATAIMSAPAGDASYLISVYESTESCTIVPVLRWTDENGVTQSQQGSVGPSGGNCYLSLLANIRVQAKTKPTIETSGEDNASHYSLYVSGLGFWPSGAQGQGGLSEVTGSLPNADLIYVLSIFEPSASTSALLVAYSTGYVGNDIPYVSWTDEYGTNSLEVPVGTSAVVPVRIAGGTKVWIHTYPGDTTWYGLIVFGAPAKGSGPFGDYEANLLDWTAATYPSWQTVFTAGSAGANVLLLGDMTQPANDGTASEGLQIYWANDATGSCVSALVADPSGIPATCVSPAFVGSNSPLQFRTYNTTGNPWGPSPTYSAEVDVLQF